jgi:hypothetical protein
MVVAAARCCFRPRQGRRSKAQRHSLHSSKNAHGPQSATHHPPSPSLYNKKYYYNALRANRDKEVHYLLCGSGCLLLLCGMNHCIQNIPAGHVMIVQDYWFFWQQKTREPRILAPGLHFGVNPFQSRTLVSTTRNRHYSLRTRVWCNRGIKIFVSVKLEYRLDPFQALEFAKQQQEENTKSWRSNYLLALIDPNQVLDLKARSVLQEIITRQDLNDILMYKRRDIGTKICHELKEALGPQGLVMGHVIIEDVELPYKTLTKVQEVGTDAFQKLIQKKQEELQNIQAKGDDDVRKIVQSCLGEHDEGDRMQ